jgi:hypothetical protein
MTDTAEETKAPTPWDQFRARILGCNAGRAAPGFAQEHVARSEDHKPAQAPTE